MSVATSERVCPPVMGERARVACGVEVGGAKRRRLLVLLAAYADAGGGVCNPPVDELLGRIPSIGSAQKLFGLARRLEADGLIRQLPKRKGWEMVFLDAEPAGGE